jgi:hypothetical protein
MIYTFLKKIIPVFIVSMVIYSLIFVIYVGGMTTSSYLIKQKALEIKERSLNDHDFANNIKIWVYNNIKYIDSGTMEIKPPEITFLTKQGDCSEDSLLMAKMLNEGGIEAHPIYGSTGIERHESVEYTINGTTQRVDETEFPNFVKHGDGIQSIEYIYDVYWFMDWKTIMGMNNPNKQWKY